VDNVSKAIRTKERVVFIAGVLFVSGIIKGAYYLIFGWLWFLK